MNDLHNLALNRRTLERILIDVNLDEITALSNSGINCAVTLMQLISASDPEKTVKEAIATLKDDYGPISRAAMPAQMELSQWDESDETGLGGLKHVPPAMIVHQVGPSVVNQMGLLSREQLNIVVCVLRFLLLTLGQVRL